MPARDPWDHAKEAREILFHEIVRAGEPEDATLSFTSQSGYHRDIRKCVLFPQRHNGMIVRCAYADERNVAGMWLSWIDVSPDTSPYNAVYTERRAVVACRTRGEAHDLARWRYAQITKGRYSKVQIRRS